MATRKKDGSTTNFGDLETAEFFVKFQDGQFFDINLQKFVSFKDGALLQIVSALGNINDEVYDQVIAKQITDTLPVGAVLYFNMAHDTGALHFAVRLTTKLQMLKKNNKIAKIMGGGCEIYELYCNGIHTPLNINVGSLNQAYIQMSTKYRPGNRLHHCNVYDTFHTIDGQYLSSFRY